MDIRTTPSSSRPVSLAALLIISSAAAILCLPGAAAQGPPAENPTAPVTSANPGAEPPSASVKIKANLVIVPVVVRDSSGHAVGSLHREDFLLFDNRKSQGITQFAIEKSEQADSGSIAAGAAKTNKRFIAPDRFTAILFDDLHSTFGNLPQLQAASLQLVSGALARTERLGIFTTSGKITVEFTDDRNKLQDAIRRLKPNPLPGSRGDTCPDISYFDANQIVNRGDTSTSDAAVGQIMAQCGVKDPKLAAAMVREASERILRVGDLETEAVLRALSTVLSRLSGLPGQRTAVLASPSFLVSDREHREYTVIDRAVRSHVIISTLDTRGIYTDQYEIADSNVLSEFADGTGGTFFHNNNDMKEGLRRVAAAPEFIYQLGFSPSDLQEDGKYHQLKVKLAGNYKFSVAARDGYFAPKHKSVFAQDENSEINDVLFSQSEIHDLPIHMQTQFVQDDKPIAKLSIRTFVDLDDLPRHQVKGQNANELRMIAAIFDHNGKYIGAIDRNVAVHWPDDRTGTQTASTFSFLLDSGAYLIRLVVRDTESQHLSAQNALVEIP